MFTALTIFVIFAGIIIWNLMIVVPMRQSCVLERFGNFRRVLEPGFHVVVPFLDKVAYRHEIREQVFDIPAQSCITRDNIQVAVDGLVYLKVMDAKRASYGIGDYQMASVNLAQTTMRSEIGKLTLGDTFYERDKLNESIVREIDKASDPWGIKVMRYEIKNIEPSAQVHPGEADGSRAGEARRHYPGHRRQGVQNPDLRGPPAGGDQYLRG